ncbi:MAG: hypothetical protein ABJA32_03510 [Ginsengibacter sp.]
MRLPLSMPIASSRYSAASIYYPATSMALALVFVFYQTYSTYFLHLLIHKN